METSVPVRLSGRGAEELRAEVQRAEELRTEGLRSSVLSPSDAHPLGRSAAQPLAPWPPASAELLGFPVPPSLEKVEKEMNSEADKIELSSFPPKIALILSRFDLDNDGSIDTEELEMWSKLLQIVSHAEKGSTDWRLPFHCFPKRMHKALHELDKDGDGYLDTSEIEHGIQSLLRQRKKATNMLRALMALGLFTLLLVFAMGAMTFYVIELTKDTHMSGNGTLVTKNTGETVQVQSSDFEFVDGMLVSRQQCVKEGTCAESPMATTEASYVNALTSEAADEAVLEMKQLTLWQDGETFLSLKVQGCARVRDEESVHGTVLVYFTSMGMLMVDNTTISTDEALAETFQKVGFSMEEPGTSTRGLFGGLKFRKRIISSDELGTFSGMTSRPLDFKNVLKPTPQLGGKLKKEIPRFNYKYAAASEVNIEANADISSGQKEPSKTVGGVYKP